MATLSNQDDHIKTALRLPRDLHARIQESARVNGRSMNAEIADRLQSSFNFEMSLPGSVEWAKLKDRIKSIEDIIVASAFLEDKMKDKK